MRAFWVTVCLSVLTVLWSLWYVNTRGFSRKWRRVLMSELDKRGVHVAIKRLTLNPLRGLVAKEVRVMTAAQHGRLLATIDEIVLDINYSNLLHHEPCLNAADLRDATLSLPLDPSNRNSERLDVSGLNARILLPPHQLYIAQAEADVHGLHVTATGRFVNPEKFQAGSDGKDSASPAVGHQAHSYLRALNRLKLSGGNPKLELQFNGDLAQPAGIFAQAVLRSGSFTVGERYPVQSVQVTARFVDGMVRLDQCAVTDSHGALEASGTFLPGTGEANVQLRSSLDLPELIRATSLAEKLEDVAFLSPPTLELTGQGSVTSDGFVGKLLGRFSLDQFAVRGIEFESAQADFSWAGDRWFVHDARIQHRSGSAVVSLMQTPGDFRVALDSSIDLKAFLPLIPNPPKDLETLEFRTAPVIHLEGHGAAPELSKLEFSGKASVGAGRYRGIAVQSVFTNFTLKNDFLTCRDIKLERTEGVGTGTVTYDLDKDILQLIDVKTTLVPSDVLMLFQRELAQHVLPYRFKTRPALVANGSIDCKRGRWEQNQLRIDVDGSCGMEYVFLKKNLATPKIKGTVSIVRDRIKLDGLEATLFGGTARGAADISLLKSQGDYTASISTEDIDFPSLTKLYFDYDTSKGKLDGAFNFSGKHDFAKEIKGTGKLMVNEGNVFAIPMLGPFSGILEEILPGTGFNQAHKGTCTFDMRDGVIHTDDLAVEGKGFSMFGSGKLFILEDKLDFIVRLNAQGAAGMLLNPVSHLLEFTADNSLSKPNWRPKRLPKALFPAHETHATPAR